MSRPKADLSTGAASALDLANCDREPIHIPGSIQPQGILLTLDANGTVLQASENVERMLGLQMDRVLGKPLATILGPEQSEPVLRNIAKGHLSVQPVLVGTLHIGLSAFIAVAHSHDGVAILELEPAGEAHPVQWDELQPFLGRLQGVHAREELAHAAAEEVRRITGFDRVLVYEFDTDWNGTVIAESRNDVLPAYLDLRFPASDIPRQARDLYRKNRLRLIEDVDYQPAAVVPANNPKTGQPLDMSYATLRSVSPIHREYMRNMETATSMSVSILRNGELWGLLSCHNREPLHVPFTVRTACDFIGQILSLQMEAQERNVEGAERVRRNHIESKLLSRMTEQDDFAAGLLDSPQDLLAFADASGAAVVDREHFRRVDETPSEGHLFALAEWLDQNALEDVFHTDRLATVYPAMEGSAAVASGLLAIRVSQTSGTYVMWFRPEVIETVRWGGDPSKPVQASSREQQLHPRKSFETWKETVRLRAKPWSNVIVEGAGSLRNSIVGIVLRQAEEMAALSAELDRSNKELETFSYSVSHDLRAPFRHIVGFSELLKGKESEHLSAEGRRYIETIIDSARHAGSLVDHLLELSRMGRRQIHTAPVNLNALTHEVVNELKPATEGRNVSWQVAELPEVSGDPTMLRVVMRNLLSNAVKFTRDRPNATIGVGWARDNADYRFWVEDNGAGFDMRYSNKLYGVFQRLHRQDEFEGAGVGLAHVRRIIARHRGKTWAEGEVGKGATFYFTLPAPTG